MQGSHLVPRFGPTTEVVKAFLEQLRHVPQQPSYVALPRTQPHQPRGRTARGARAAPEHRQAAVQAAQQAVAEVLQDLSWPPDTTAVQQYVERTAPQAVAVLVPSGFVAPAEIADEYEQIYESGWRAVF